MSQSPHLSGLMSSSAFFCYSKTFKTIYIYTYVYIVCMCVYMYSCIYACMNAYIHVCMHVYTQTHTAKEIYFGSSFQGLWHLQSIPLASAWLFSGSLMEEEQTGTCERKEALMPKTANLFLQGTY